MPSPGSKQLYSYAHRGWKFPTLGFVLQLHEAVINDSGGQPGVLDEGRLASAVNAPIESACVVEAFHGLLDKVAALGYRLAMHHGFQDGNKRTSLLTMQQTLAWQGYYLKGWTDGAKVLIMSLLGAGYLPQDGLRHALVLGCGLDPSDENLP